MAIWRQRDVEALLGGVPMEQGAITEEGLRALVREVPAESEWVEYKSKHDILSKKPKPASATRPERLPAQERAKDVCAAANGRGALIVYGVEDEKKDADPEKRMNPFEGTDNSSDLIDNIRRNIRQFATPVPLFDVFAVPQTTGDGFYIAVVIPPSPLAPHAVVADSGDSRKALHYHLRHPGESHIRYLTEYEVAQQYQLRARRQEERREHLTRLWNDGARALRTPSVWLAVAITPEFPAADDRLTPQAINDIKDWEDLQVPFPDLLLDDQRSFARQFPAPGKLVYTEAVMRHGISAPGVVGSYREFHPSGAAFAALPVATDIPSGADADVTVDQLVDVAQALTRHCIDWVLERTGRWGTATMTIGMTGPAAAGVYVQIVGDVPPRYRLNNTRRLDSTTDLPIANVAVDLGSIDTMQDKLAAACDAALPIVQAFGVAEPNWITDTGAINTFELLSRASRYVRSWAADHDVELDGTAR